MYESIHTRLARVPDEAILFPGHLYSQDPSQSMGDTGAGTMCSGRAPLRSGWRCSVHESRRTSSPRTARCSSWARRSPDGEPSRPCAPRASRGSLPDRRGASPALRPPTALQAGVGRDVASGEGGPGGQTTVERAPGPRGARPPRRPARRRTRKVELDDGTVLEGDAIVIATGAQPAPAGDRSARPTRRIVHAAHPRRLARPARPRSRRWTRPGSW